MVLPLLVAAALASPGSIEIRDVTVIDVRTGIPAPHRSVLIEGDKIEQIVRSGEMRQSASKVVDAHGKYLIPGLWDMHVHFFLPDFYWGLFTANGVTGARVMFGDPQFLKLNEKFMAGQKVGPRLYVGGPIVDGPKPIWPGSVSVKSPEEGRAVVHKQLEQGFAFVKVYSALPRDSYLAIADECKIVGMPFEGHLPMAVTLREASDEGQRSVEHLLGTIWAFAGDGGKLEAQAKALAMSGDYAKFVKEGQSINHACIEQFDPSAGKELVRTLLKNHTYICPTLTVLNSTAHLDDPSLVSDARSTYVPKFLTTAWDPSKDFRFKNRTPESWKWAKRTYDEELRITGILAKAEVPILAGTDCMNPYCYPGFSLHDELQLLVKAGLTNLQALQAATSHAADFMGLTDVGDVKVGSKADLLLLDSNPLLNIANTQRIFMVFNHGAIFDRPSLDGILAKAKELSGKNSVGQRNAIPAGLCEE